ncbi:spore germination protein KB [Paenibacillus cellulosilyticus]|uniref:Spore germination protein KB n=1 Tax=Paenibacillus cellulosilyticus TaxID=375489 RepID=A0A2V2YZI3_9BACL|nr:endospore germination permease [Paenibacillus cellulosilyticus]PWW08413.1 spore germination protein KB [Paenibacillus cellulosilyticus]QKS48001.1 endospore germination permease [Paenibacillus cellulosilyticus]
MERGQVSAAQVAVLSFTAVTATSLLTAPTVVSSVVKQDVWLSPLLALPIGFLIVWLIVKLNQIYPDQTLVQYSMKLLGRPLGIAVNLIYLFFIIHTTAYVLRQFTDFMKLTFLFTTPAFVVASSMILVCALIVRSGVEIVVRFPMLLLPVVLSLILMVYMPSIKDINLHNFEPVLSEGLVAPLKGAFRLMSWVPVFTFMNFYLPFVSNKRHVLWWAFGSVTIFTAIVFTTFVMVYAIIGAATPIYVYPFMVLARFISLTEFFEHLESLVMMVWVIVIIVRISFGLYSASLGLAQCLGFPSYRPLVLPISMIMVLLSYWSVSNVEFVFSPEFIIYYLIFGIGLPALLLTLSTIRQRFSKPHNGQDEQGEYNV